MVVRVKALVRGIPDNAVGCIRSALSESFGADAFEIITPSSDSDANLSAADAVHDSGVVLVVFGVAADAYIEGKSGAAVRDTDKYFKYANSISSLVTWLNRLLEVNVSVPRSVEHRASSDLGAGRYDAEETVAHSAQRSPSGAGVAGSGYSVGGDSTVELIELRARVESLNTAYTNLRRSYADQSAVLSDTQHSLADANTRLSQANSDMDSLRRLKEEAESKLVDAEGRASRAEDRVESLQKELSSVKNTLDGVRRELDGAKGDSSRLGIQLQEAQEELGRRTSERDEALASVQSLEAEVGNLSAEKDSLSSKYEEVNKTATMLAQKAVSGNSGLVEISPTNWAYLASRSSAQDTVLVPQYSGSASDNVFVVAAGSDGAAQLVAQFFRSSILLGYSGSEASRGLSGFRADCRTLVVDLATDTYMDYYLNSMGYDSTDSSGLDWLSGKKTLQEAMRQCREDDEGLWSVGIGLGYVNEAWLLNVDWPARLRELGSSGMNVLISVGDLGSHVRRVLYKSLCLASGHHIVITGGTKLAVRATVANMDGLFPANKVSSWLHFDCYLMNPRNSIKNIAESLMKSTVTLYESRQDENRVWKSSVFGRGVNHGA